MHTAIDPIEWRKEVERVKDQLNFKIAGSLSIAYETEAEEANQRRNQILDNAKVVWEFQESNIPVLLETLILDWDTQLYKIRSLEGSMTANCEA